MAYVGNTPADKTLKLEKQQFTTSATTSYTLSHSVSDPQDIALFINNVRQNPNSSYTVSGTALTLSEATSASDTMYCVFLGRAIGTTGIAAGEVTKDKLDLISDATAGLTVKGDGGSNDGYLQLNCRVNSHGIKLKSPPHSAGATYTLTFPNSVTADKFLKTDGSGNLSFASAGGITVADQWRLSVAITSPTQNANTVISSNWERNDSTAYGVLGSGMSESSGIFSFPSTGFYLVRYVMMHSANGDTYFGGGIEATTNNSSYSEVATQFNYFDYSNSTIGGAIFCESLLDVTDVSNIKVRFFYNTNNGTYINGNSSKNQTYATFIRLGDT